MATEDRREEILARLLTVLKSVDAVDERSVQRNKEVIAETALPAIIMYDADENQPDNFAVDGRGRPPEGKLLLEMSPEIFIATQLSAKNVGTALNELRAAVIKAVMSDTQLKMLCHQIIYTGFTPALAAGRDMVGQARMHFSFQYVLRIDKL